MKQPAMKKFALGLAATLFCLGSASAQAQTYPQAPITWIVPYATGGATDTVARIFAQAVAKDLQQTVVVENRPGAASRIGAEQLIRSAPDGYTVMSADNATLTINPALVADLPYDPATDFSYISMAAHIPLLLAANMSVPATNVAELIAYAKANPGKLNYGSPGTGSPHHIAMELFLQQSGTTMQHIPYKGSAPALNDMIGGQIQLMFLTWGAAKPQMEVGRIKVFGVGSPERLASAPDIPTLSEAGVPGFQFSAWQGIVAPKGIPAEALTTLNASLNRILATPEVRQALEAQGVEPLKSTPEAFAEYSRSEGERIKELVKTNNIRLE